VADRQRRELERAASEGDPVAQRRLTADRVRLGELSLLRPAENAEAWVQELMQHGVLAGNAVVRLIPHESKRPGPWDGRSWWWIRLFVGDARRGWKVELVRLSQRGLRPLATSDTTSRSRNFYAPSLPNPLGFPRDHVDAAAWFAKNLLEIRLDPLSRQEAAARDRRHSEGLADRRSGPRGWEPRDLLDEYASFPEWHERLSVYATHLNQGRDLERVLVARKGRRGVWHVVDQVQLKGVVPECAKSARDDSFQGEVRWGEPTCLRCRRSAQWDSPTMGPGRRSERRTRQKGYLEWAMRALEDDSR